MIQKLEPRATVRFTLMLSDKDAKLGRMEKWMVDILANIMHISGEGMELRVGCSFTSYTGPPYKETTESSFQIDMDLRFFHTFYFGNLNSYVICFALSKRPVFIKSFVLHLNCTPIAKNWHQPNRQPLVNYVFSSSNMENLSEVLDMFSPHQSCFQCGSQNKCNF